MPEQLKIVVSEKEAGSRLDVVLSDRQSDISRNVWQKAIRSGSVQVNRKVAKAVKTSLKVGDIITAGLPETIQLSLKPHDRPIAIIYEDDDVIVIDKPASLVVHPVRVGEASLAGSLAGKIDSDGSLRPGIVHRLDRDTSGVMIVAKNESVREFLAKQFKTRSVSKKYLALVWGRPKHDEASIEVAIGRDPRRGDRWRVASSGRAAQTKYRLLSTFSEATLVEVRPQSGRTHQIRVHFAHLGTPVAGDKMYGGKRTGGPSRQFLHATSLEITIPSGQRKTFTAELPPELNDYLKGLK